MQVLQAFTGGRVLQPVGEQLQVCLHGLAALGKCSLPAFGLRERFFVGQVMAQALQVALDIGQRPAEPGADLQRFDMLVRQDVPGPVGQQQAANAQDAARQHGCRDESCTQFDTAADAGTVGHALLPAGSRGVFSAHEAPGCGNGFGAGCLPYRHVADGAVVLAHRHHAGIDPVERPVLAAVFQCASPGLSLVQGVPHVGKQHGRRIGVPHDVVRLVQEFFAGKAADRHKGIIGIDDDPLEVGTRNQHEAGGDDNFTVSDGQVVLHAAGAPPAGNRVCRPVRMQPDEHRKRAGRSFAGAMQSMVGA